MEFCSTCPEMTWCQTAGECCQQSPSDPLIREIERLREANANNLEGWMQNVAGLNRKILTLEKELEETKKLLQEKRNDNAAAFAARLAMYRSARDRATRCCDKAELYESLLKKIMINNIDQYNLIVSHLEPKD